MFFLALGAELYVVISVLPHFDAVIPTVPFRTLCTQIIGAADNEFGFIWYDHNTSSYRGEPEFPSRLPTLTFDTCAFCMAVYTAIQWLRDGTLQASRIMQVLIRDSVTYFLA